MAVTAVPAVAVVTLMTPFAFLVILRWAVQYTDPIVVGYVFANMSQQHVGGGGGEEEKSNMYCPFTSL